ncbi:MAG: DUF4445 domain-containing protein [Xanthobacteraceae bacterium]|nr:MAG: DUF4445 domain-containing protein [Xanthobacteraceae bacterium]
MTQSVTGKAGPTHLLHFPQIDREIPSGAAETIFQSARRNGVRIVGACGGRGTCGTCTVLITEGRIHRDGEDAETIDENEHAKRRRKWVRSCQVRAVSNCVVEVAARSLAPVVRADVHMGEAAEMLALDAAVAAAIVHVAEATLEDTAADLDRVIAALPQPAARIDAVAVRALTGVLRDNGWSVRVLRHGDELIGFTRPGARLLGMAVDLGTTNAAAFLVDLETGMRLASLGIENPQVAWGGDLISRINYAIRDAEAAAELRESAVTAINALASDLCRSVDATPHDIVDIAVCGNTAMQHLLLGLPVRQLGRAPFVAAVRDAVEIKARDLGLAIAPGAYLTVAPNVGGFVGGDHVTALLATEDRWRDGRTTLVMDIGTNTEISLIHNGAILSASCPSGPALEGGHISCGMRAAEGAIERVGIENGRVVTRTIGNKPPIGLCGSGVLDALATLRTGKLIDDTGRFADGHPDIAEVNGKRALVLGDDVYFGQHDIRAVQLAKAAIRTGVELLLAQAGIEADDIAQFIIAGAFGAYIDVRSAIAIGLLPALPLDRFEQVGNAAGVGIRMMLASRAARERAREIARQCRYVELSTKADFQKSFLFNIGFRTRPHSRRGL